VVTLGNGAVRGRGAGPVRRCAAPEWILTRAFRGLFRRLPLAVRGRGVLPAPRGFFVGRRYGISGSSTAGRVAMPSVGGGPGPGELGSREHRCAMMTQARGES